jgi:hypothetical protein
MIATAKALQVQYEHSKLPLLVCKLVKSNPLILWLLIPVCKFPTGMYYFSSIDTTAYSKIESTRNLGGKLTTRTVVIYEENILRLKWGYKTGKFRATGILII